MTSLVILKNGQPVKQGLEVSIHWTGFTSGISKYTVGTSGYVIIPDDVLNGSSRKADEIFVQKPDSNGSVKFTNITIQKSQQHILDLSLAS